MAEAVLTNTNDPVPPGHATAPHAWKLDDIFTAPTVNVFALDRHQRRGCVPSVVLSLDEDGSNDDAGVPPDG